MSVVGERSGGFFVHGRGGRELDYRYDIYAENALPPSLVTVVSIFRAGVSLNIHSFCSVESAVKVLLNLQVSLIES